MNKKNSLSMTNHHDVVESHHRFSQVTYMGATWDLTHLDAFAIKVDLELVRGTATSIDVIVLFACHCFTRGIRTGLDDGIDSALVFDDGREQRILDPERFAYSLQYLPSLVNLMVERTVQVANPTQPNYVIFETPSRGLDGDVTRGGLANYAVFFELEKDTKRKRRVLLRIQSAYVLQEPKDSLLKGDKVRFKNLLKRTYQGIRGKNGI